MRRNFVFETFNEAIPRMFGELLRGEEVGSRVGRTLELPFTGITILKPQHREILVPGRKHNLAAQIAETVWVLAGRNDVEWLERYLPRARDFSDDGKTWRAGYGPRMRHGCGDQGYIDQLAHVVETLRATPSSRQAVISLWDPSVDSIPGKDIACNNWLHFLSREGYLDLHVAVRSNDAMWGWSGINVFEFSTLLEMVAGMVGLNIGQLHFSVSSFHLYEQHWDKAEKIAEYGNKIQQQKESPRFSALGLDDMHAFDHMTESWFAIEEEIRKYAGQVNVPSWSGHLTTLIEEYPEPMLQSWLRVIAWWWTGNDAYLTPLKGTDLAASAFLGVQPGNRGPNPITPPQFPPSPKRSNFLIDTIVALHNEKDEAYGNSWCKRGEILGILANIARKIDRLGGGSTADESSLDTAMDLYVYTAKYMDWLRSGRNPIAAEANLIMRETAKHAILVPGVNIDILNESLRRRFEDIEALVIHGGNQRQDTKVEVLLGDMLDVAWDLVNELAAV